jgi:plasmid stabilization system protein ParE
MKITFSEVAIAQLKDIYNYYKSYASLKIAQSIKEKILSSVKLLKRYPKLGGEELTLTHLNRGYRRMVVGNYKIVYRIIDESIFVDAIFDARQAPEKL